MRSFEAPKEFLISVMNELRRHNGDDDVNVKDLYIGNRLFTISLDDWGLSNIISKNNYDVKYKGIANRCTGNIASEIPNWGKMQSCFWSSLVTPPEKKVMGEMVEVINNVIEQSRKGINYTGQTAISIDTNLMYNRLITRLFLERKRFGIDYDNCKDLMVLVSSKSLDELTAPSHKKLDKRYNPDELINCIPNKETAKALFNRPTLRARMSLNGMAEIARLRESFSYYLADDGQQRFRDSDLMDNAIVDEVYGYCRENNIRLSFLTADDSMYTLLMAKNVRHLTVKYPKNIPGKINPGPWLLRELLYDLALTYGGLELEGSSVKISGFWKEKVNKDYIENENILVTVDENSNIGKAILRNDRIRKRFERSDKIDLNRLR